MIIRKLRLDLGLSQEQLADMSGTSVRTIQRVERGAPASAETLKNLAAALDTDFNDLREDHQMTDTHDQTRRMSAREREAMEYVRDIKGFYAHALQFGLVMLVLLALNLWLSPEFLWVIFPAIGWGIGLASHGLAVFEVFDLLGRDWEKRQIEKRLRR